MGRAAINNATNWVGHDKNRPTVPASFSVRGKRPLAAGDCAVVGYQADNPDDFGVLLLEPISAGQKIFATDNGVNSDGSLRSGEGIRSFTAADAVSAGTVLRSEDFSAAEAGKFALSSNGDQIIIFTGSA